MVSVDHGPESIYRAEARCHRCGATDGLVACIEGFRCRVVEWCEAVVRRRRRTS
jgi:hypothetical protein